MNVRGVVTLLILSVLPTSLLCADELDDALSELATMRVADQPLGDMVRLRQREKLRAANQRSSEQWRKIKSLKDWTTFRQQRLDALRASLGDYKVAGRELDVRVSRTIDGPGYQIRNLTFDSHFGLQTTANLYLPADRPDSMPGILICHSHHRPKEHGELQDMGMTWARAGCAVLVMDQLGHGERRQHPFRTSADFDGEFRVSRQDYYFRYDTGIQLHLVGKSLIGWMAHDLMRGVDVLLAEPGVDRQRIMLLGAVAGGGDPAAVAAALDDRITVAAPFNFGGPQPETRYPLPDDVETSFNYAGSGSWESTRNLRRSAMDGFLPWTIVGGIAPRRLIFAHEFSWDRQRDPVWKRLRRIYELHEHADHLDYTHGRGELRGRPPEATHCTHIGRFHRRRIHDAMARWFSIPVSADDEYSKRLDSVELRCVGEADPLKPLQKALALRAEMLRIRRNVRTTKDGAPRDILQRNFRKVLGDIDAKDWKVVSEKSVALPAADGKAIVLQTEPGIQVPLLLLLPKERETKPPVVVAVAQAGKAGFLKNRGEDLATLLNAGVAVCLPDLRGVGESKAGNARGKRSAATSRSSTQLMLGETTVGARLKDLRCVIRYLETNAEVDAKQVAVWGDSFASPNPPDARFRAPRRIDNRARESEPLGGMLALLTVLYEPQVGAVCVNGGLASLQSVLDSPFVFVPHDVVVPGWLQAGDLEDLAGLAAPRPLRMTNLVDGWNRPLKEAEAKQKLELVRVNYDRARAGEKLSFSNKSSAATWLLQSWARHAEE